MGLSSSGPGYRIFIPITRIRIPSALQKLWRIQLVVQAARFSVQSQASKSPMRYKCDVCQWPQGTDGKDHPKVTAEPAASITLFARVVKGQTRGTLRFVLQQSRVLRWKRLMQNPPNSVKAKHHNKQCRCLTLCTVVSDACQYRANVRVFKLVLTSSEESNKAQDSVQRRGTGGA